MKRDDDIVQLTINMSRRNRATVRNYIKQHGGGASMSDFVRSLIAEHARANGIELKFDVDPVGQYMRENPRRVRYGKKKDE